MIFGAHYLRKLAYLVFSVMPFLPAWTGVEIAPGAPLLNPTKLLLLLLGLAWLIRKALTLKWPLPDTIWARLILALFFLQALSVGWAAHWEAAVVALLAYAGYYYLPYFFVCDTFRSAEEIRRLIFVLAVVGTLAGAVAIVEAFTGYNLWRQVDWRELSDSGEALDNVRYGLARASGGFSNYIALGMFLGLSWPLWLAFDGLRKPRSRQVAVGALLLFGLMATFAPVARGAILGAVAAIIVALLLMTSIRVKAKAGALGLLLFVLLSIGFPESIRSVIEGISVFARDSFDPEYAANFYGRLDVVPLDFALLVEQPLIGYGFGEATRAYQTGSPLGDTVRSYYLSLALESGLPALLVFLWLTVGSLVLLARRALGRGDPALKRTYAAISLSLFSLLIALSSVNMTEPFFYMFVLLAAGHRLTQLQGGRYPIRTVDAATREPRQALQPTFSG